ncbi:MAG: NmrA family NAD(P)-binding protein [Chloroflexota bacterium]
MKVLVYGGTGSQGSPVVTTLIERGHTPVVFTRNVEKARETFGEAAEYVAGDMASTDDTRAAAEGVDALALMIPFFTRNPLEDAPLFARNAINGAKDAGVSLIVYNTSGPLPAGSSNMPGAAPRIYTRQLLAESGIPHIILAPTVYMENLLGPWTVNEIREQNVLPYPNPPQVHAGWVATADVARLQVAALEHPELADATYIVSGVENPTGPELAAQVGAGIGREITYREMPLDEFAAKIDAVFGPGAGAGAKAGYEYARQHADEVPPMWVDMEPLLKTLDVEMTSINTWAARMKPVMAPVKSPSM